MKNHKGVVATLLTLGLVLVGTLITLGSSLFISNQKTNLALNSRAATLYSCCKVYETSSACAGKKRIQNQGNSFVSTCAANNLVDCSAVGGPPTSGASICPVSGPVAGAENGACKSTTPKCDGTLVCTGGVCVKPAAGPVAGAENGACKSTTPKCDGTLVCTGGVCVKPAAGPAAGALGGACRSAAPKCDGALVCNTSNICAASTSEGQTANQITTSTAVGTGQSCCFQKKGKVYVYSSYQSMVNNDMLDDAGNPDCGRQTGAVVNSYQADNPPGAFVCAGGTANMTTITSYNETNTTNASGNNGQTNGDLVVPEGCNGTNCQVFFPDGINFLATVLVSTNKTGPATYYKSGNCADGSKANPNTLGELRSYCSTASAAEASVTCAPNLSCKEAYSGNGNKYSYSIDDSGTTTYYKGNSCYGTPKATGEADVKTYCTEDPTAEANAVCKPDVSCTATGSTNNTKSKTSTKTYSGKTVYYESNDCSTGAVTKETAKAYCDSQPTISNDPHENVAFANPNLSFCDKGGAKLYTEPDLPAFALSCQAKYPNSCYQIIISNIGWFTSRDYMYCCYKSCQ